MNGHARHSPRELHYFPTDLVKSRNVGASIHRELKPSVSRSTDAGVRGPRQFKHVGVNQHESLVIGTEPSEVVGTVTAVHRPREISAYGTVVAVRAPFAP